MENQISKSYLYALELVNNHYENFPIASLFLSKKYHKHIAIIYYFARTCDDIADLSNEIVENKLKLLNDYQHKLHNIEKYKHEPFWNALYQTEQETSINLNHLINLIEAFKKDLVKNRYNSFDELYEYTVYSAQPVGRMILELFNCDNENTVAFSDKICSALQITNFLQDIPNDLKINRIYFPLNELSYFNLCEKDFFEHKYDIRFIRFMKFQINRTRKMFLEGSELLNFVPFKLKMHLRLVINGGLRILKKIEKNNYDIYKKNIKLNKFDFIKIFLKNEYKRGKYLKQAKK